MTLYNLYMMTMAGAGHTMLMSAGTWGDDPSGLENVYKCFYVIHACK